uniref:E3 ubiquitin-protein ligase RNF168-like n=1 Tax=Jaculus jaculus TaxID=51337 RepID=UPI001E1B2E27|nr:E3 ubiquitin-protein ligase RNF168-like [Jaculus jaculus]
MAASKFVAPSLSECQCLLCTEILIEPVTFPCDHTVCKPCFQELLLKMELRCPFCRTWISSWVQYHSQRNTLTDLDLWAKVQRHFPQECRLRASGQETGLVFESDPPVHVLIAPGELRREYEVEKKKMEAELKAQKEKEEKASAEYIQSLLEEEEEEEQKLLAEKRQKELEEQLKREEEERKLSINNPATTKASRKRKMKQKHGDTTAAQSQSGSTSQPEVQEVRSALSDNRGSLAEGPGGQDRNVEENVPTPAPQTSLEIQNQGEKSTVQSPMLSPCASNVEWGVEENVPRPSCTGINSTKENPKSLLVSARGRKVFRKYSSELQKAKINVMEKMAHLEQLYFEKQKQEEQDRLFALQLHEKLNKTIIKKWQKELKKENITNDITTPPNTLEMENECTTNSNENDS